MRKQDERRAAIQDELAALLGDRLSVSATDREVHSHGEGLPDAGMPDFVTYPVSTEEVAGIASICSRYTMPMVPFGVGSSLEGQVAALEGGVSIDMTRMDRIIEVAPDSLDCLVQAGVTRVALNTHLRDSGLFFPLDPGADATLGGMAATRASGTNAVGYGTMRDVVLALTVVTPAGQVIRTGSRARKSSTGYDLTRLYIGSEGTLGIITELRLRLEGRPEAIETAVCQFPDLASAAEAATLARQMGLRVVRLELLDDVQMDACIRYQKLDGMVAAPTLFVEIHGTPQAAKEQLGLFHDIARDFGCTSFEKANSSEDRTRLWKVRHEAYQAVMALSPGRRNMGTDACVPLEKLTQCILETQADVQESGLIAPIVGHVGDGNFHLGILFDPQDLGERDRADALAARVSRRAIALGGTCSGEHGVGMHKTRYLVDEHGNALEVMRAIKAALDPNGLMNPGKLIPPRE